MPNPHISDRQLMRYMTSRSQHQTQSTAAAMAGISERSARRMDKDPRFPSQKKQPRTWRNLESFARCFYIAVSANSAPNHPRIPFPRRIHDSLG
jgi:hypothetical protein